MRASAFWRSVFFVIAFASADAAFAQAPRPSSLPSLKPSQAPQGQSPKPRALLIKVEKDVEYGRAGGEVLRLDLYLPAEEVELLRPGILFIHGGGWIGGDKADLGEKARDMAERGYVAASVNYRLAPKHRYPAAIEDVQQAVRWLRQRAAELRLDPERIGAMGESAGGHLAAMLGVLNAREGTKPPNETSARLQCVVNYYGRMDLTLEQSGPGYTDYRPAFIGKTKTEALPLYVEASPITHVNSGDAPMLIVQGMRDRQVIPVHSERMLAALDKVGVEAYLLLIPNAGHGFRGTAALQAWDTARAFLDRMLLKKPDRVTERHDRVTR